MTTAVESAVKILPVSFAAILDAPNSADLLRAYAEECSVSGAEPQREIYSAMENAGALHCFASYVDDLLIGFCTVLTAQMPHTGDRLATVESIFVDPTYRHSGAGDILLTAAEQFAREAGCSNLACLARLGSAFDVVLSRRACYHATHTQHTRRLK